MQSPEKHLISDTAQTIRPTIDTQEAKNDIQQYHGFTGKSENPNIKNWPILTELCSAFTLRHTSVTQ